MYICEISGEVVPTKSRSKRVILAVRPVYYQARPGANRRRVRRKKKEVGDPGGHGWEVVKEVLVCQRVFEQYQNIEPEVMPAKERRPNLLQQIEEQICV
jgi:hypothetical protein